VLARDLASRGVTARALPDADAIAEGVLADARPGDLVLILSNGAFGGIYDRFRAALGETADA
jgi:UDP-N-acetylmuramate: L-alanyl-gamma-D-glutamyl-meso-diaminopimelate ligase